MKIRMLKPRNALKVGVVAEVPDGVAEMWIQRGVAKRMVPVDVAPETVVIDTTHVTRPKRSGKTRSRKRVTA